MAKKQKFIVTINRKIPDHLGRPMADEEIRSNIDYWLSMPGCPLSSDRWPDDLFSVKIAKKKRRKASKP